MSAIHSPSFQHVIKLGAKLKMSLNLLFFILFFPPKKFEGFFVFFFLSKGKVGFVYSNKESTTHYYVKKNILVFVG